MNAINSLIIKWLFPVAAICTTLPTYGNTPGEVNAAKPVASQASCSAEDLRGRTNVRVKDIVGMYRQSVGGLPAYGWPSTEKRSGSNYLAITSVEGNQLRVKLASKEINGHNCSLDSQALLCGASIRLIPSDEEKSALDITKQPTPSLRVTGSHITFNVNPDSAVVSGYPYCGNRGALNQSFKRITRSSQIDNSVFNQ